MMWLAEDLRADLEQVFAQRRIRPILDRLRRRQRAKEGAKFVDEHLRLETNRQHAVEPSGRELCAQSTISRL